MLLFSFCALPLCLTYGAMARGGGTLAFENIISVETAFPFGQGRMLVSVCRETEHRLA